MNNPMNFAVIGCGMLARHMHLPNLVALPEARLHTGCDLNDENLEACRSFKPVKISRNFSEVVADPEIDAVVIATTETYRLPIIEAAARAGKPIYCEKPLADTLENGLAIQRVVEEYELPFCVGHNRRCSPAMQDARTTFISHLNNPRSCDWRFERPGWETMDVGDNPGAPVVSIRVNDDWKSWKAVHLQNPLNQKVGLLLSEGTHFVDLANWFIPSVPVRVLCSGQGVLNHVIVIHYADGAMASIVMASTGSFGYPKELLEAIGHGGIVSNNHMLEVRTAGIADAPELRRYAMLNDRHPSLGTEGGLQGWLDKKAAACREAENGDALLQFTAEPDKGHRRMLKEFIREIRGEREPVCPVEDAILATRVCLAAAKSYLENRTVDMAEIKSGL